VASERRAAYFRASASPGAAISIMKMTAKSTCGRAACHSGANAHPARAAERVIDVANARLHGGAHFGSKLVELVGVDHSYLVGDRDALLDEFEVFLTGARHVYEPETRPRYGAVADIVGLTRSGRLQRRAPIAQLAEFLLDQRLRILQPVWHTRPQVRTSTHRAIRLDARIAIRDQGC